MSLYAIADLHLGLDPRVEKPMDIYGGRWENYIDKIEADWKERVGEDDTVIIAGDISWGLRLDEAMADIDWIAALPGRKVIIKGNHDLWWGGIGKLNKLHDSITFLQNTFAAAGSTAVCGSRGWICPGSEFTADDEKIYKRELIRLEMSLSAAASAGFTDIVGVLHYPPSNESHQPSDFTRLFEKYSVKNVVYGHLHGKEIWNRGIKGTLNGVEYSLVSQDYMDGKLLKLR